MALKKRMAQKRLSLVSDSDNSDDIQNDVIVEEEEPIQALSDPKASRKKRVRRASSDNKGVFTRVWSDEDELALLHGIIQFRLDNSNKDPTSDCKSFLDFVSPFITFHVSVKQVKDKIRHLKDKYFAKLHKGEESSVTFVKLHDENLFKLSKIVWAGENADGNNSKVKKVEKCEDGGSDFEEMYLFLSRVWGTNIDFPVPVKKFKLGAREKIRGLEKECKAVFVKDTQLYLKKLDLKAKLAKLVMDQMISADP